jgi:hypothetical protein
MPGAPWTEWSRWVARHIEEPAQVDLQFAVIGKSAAMSSIAALLLVIYAGIRTPSGIMLGWLACLSGAVAAASFRFFQASGRQHAAGALGGLAHPDGH